MRVVPGDPGKSVLYQKLLEQKPSDPIKTCGVQMPADAKTFRTNNTSELVFSGSTLAADLQQLVHDWIEEGAQDN
jgi:hypothetical protein